jgi:hypothetical protein
MLVYINIYTRTPFSYTLRQAKLVHMLSFHRKREQRGITKKEKERALQHMERNVFK